MSFAAFFFHLGLELLVHVCRRKLDGIILVVCKRSFPLLGLFKTNNV